MAQANTVRGSALLIMLGDGADPEVFAHPCSINSERGIVFAAETRNNNVPDCDDPEAVVWQGTEKASLGATINGSGTLHKDDDAVFFALWKSEESCNIKVADGNRVYSGAFQLTQYEKTGNLGEKVQVRLTFVSDGAVTDAAA